MICARIRPFPNRVEKIWDSPSLHQFKEGLTLLRNGQEKSSCKSMEQDENHEKGQRGSWGKKPFGKSRLK